MNAKKLVEINNEKRELLTEENRAYYEDLLVYIRLSYSIAEQETEEVLSELLDHLLEAQEAGKTAEDVFGKEPKKYADAIIGELPKMLTKERFLFVIMGLFYFFAVSTSLSAIVELFSYFVLGNGSLMKDYFIGTVIIKSVLSIPAALLILYICLQYLRWACFKKISKVVEFFILWFLGAASVGIFIVLLLLTPDVGPHVEIPSVVVLGIGLILYLAGNYTKRAL